MIENLDFFVTGTQAYGPASQLSDIDIVLHEEDCGRLEYELNKMGIKREKSDTNANEKYPGFYFRLGVIKFNIISAKNEKEFNEWKWATEKMRENHRNVHERTERIALFIGYRNEYLKMYGKGNDS